MPNKPISAYADEARTRGHIVSVWQFDTFPRPTAKSDRLRSLYGGDRILPFIPPESGLTQRSTNYSIG